MTLDVAVKSLRTRMGISQQKLSDEIGCTLNTIQTYESGRNTPEPRRVLAFIQIAEREGAKAEEKSLRSALRETLGVDPSKPFTI